MTTDAAHYWPSPESEELEVVKSRRLFDRDAHQSIAQRHSNAARASISCRSRKGMAIPKFEILRLRKLVNPGTPRRERLG